MSHAVQRAKDHYGVVITKDDLLWASRQITHGSLFAVYLERSLKGDPIWAVRIRCRWLPMVVIRGGFIATILHPKSLNLWWPKLNARKLELRRQGLEVKGIGAVGYDCPEDFDLKGMNQNRNPWLERATLK